MEIVWNIGLTEELKKSELWWVPDVPIIQRWSQNMKYKNPEKQTAVKTAQHEKQTVQVVLNENFACSHHVCSSINREKTVIKTLSEL